MGTNFTPNALSPTTRIIVGKDSTSPGNTRDAYITFSGSVISARTLVPLLPGSPYQDSGVPNGVNDLGNIVGTCVYSPKAYQYNIYTSLISQLPSPSSGNMAFAYAINNYNVGGIGGQIAGMNVNSFGALWMGGASSSPTTIATPWSYSGQTVTFYAINNVQGCLARYSNPYGWESLYYYNGTATPIAGAHTNVSNGFAATSINDGNVICGTYNHPTNPSPQNTYNPTACIWSSPTASATPLFDATTMTSTASSINNNNTVVGSSTLQYPNPAPSRAYVWTSASGVVDLNTVVTNLPANVVLNNALVIDNRGNGDIVGTCTVTSGGVPSTHAFLLQPN